MSREKQLIRREFLARKELLVGTVIGAPRAVRFDGNVPGAGVMWVCDLDIGSNRPLFNVPIKGGSDGSRFYANLSQTVVCRRNLLGRWQVIGPGDRKAAATVTKSYDLTTELVTATATRSFTTVIDPFEYYMGSQAMKGNPNVTFDLVGGSDDTMTRDAGSFIVDGFSSGDDVRIASPLNAGDYTINTVAALVCGFAGDVFVDEGPVKPVTMGVLRTSLWNNGSDSFPSRRIVDADGVTLSPS